LYLGYEPDPIDWAKKSQQVGIVGAAAYVLAHHAGTVKVLHTLRPFAVAMAGEGEFDPFKD
jgi:hypothetical protein